MATINDIVKMKDKNIGGVTLEQAFNNRNNLPGLVASTIDRQTPGGMFGTGIMAGDALSFIGNPGQAATNIGINAGVNEIAKRTGLGSTPIAAGLSLLQGGSIKDVASSAATSYASGALFAANPVLGGVSAAMNAIGLGGVNPLNLVGDIAGGIIGGISSLFGGTKMLSSETNAADAKAVTEALDPSNISSQSIIGLAQGVLGLANSSKDGFDKWQQMDDISNNIKNLSDKSPEPQKTALMDLYKDMQASFSGKNVDSNTPAKLEAAFTKYYNSTVGSSSNGNNTASSHSYSCNEDKKCEEPDLGLDDRNRARDDLARLAVLQMLASKKSNKNSKKLTINIKTQNA